VKKTNAKVVEGTAIKSQKKICGEAPEKTPLNRRVQEEGSHSNFKPDWGQSMLYDALLKKRNQ